MMKKMKFEKKENWNLYTFYYIYMNNNTKMIRIIGMTDRGATGKNYLSWFCTYVERPSKNGASFN